MALTRRQWFGGAAALIVTFGLAAGLTTGGAGTARAQGLPEIRQFQTAHFALDTTSKVMGIEMRMRGEGDMVMPDSMRFSLSALGQPFEVIQVGGKSYQRSALLGDANQWYVQDAAPGAGRGDVDPLAIMQAIGGLKTFKAHPDDTVGDVVAEHYEAEIDPAVMNKLVAASRPGGRSAGAGGMSVENMQFTRAAMELWVAKDTRYVVQQHLVYDVAFQLAGMPGAGAGAPPPTGGASIPGLPTAGGSASQAGAATGMTLSQDTVLRYSAFDTPITIAPPDGALPMPAR